MTILSICAKYIKLLNILKKRKLRHNLRKRVERLLAPEKHFAFRGRLLSLGPTNGFRWGE